VQRCRDLTGNRDQTAEAERKSEETLRDGLEVLQNIRGAINQAEADHVAMMSELSGATAYFAGAAAATGVLASLTIRMMAQRLAQMYTNMATNVSQVTTKLPFRNYWEPGYKLPGTMQQMGFNSLVQDLFLQKFRNHLMAESTAAAASWTGAAGVAGGAGGVSLGGFILSQGPGLLDPMKNRLITEHMARMGTLREMQSTMEALVDQRRGALEQAKQAAADAAKALEAAGCGGQGAAADVAPTG
jgi:hypothetical protein